MWASYRKRRHSVNSQDWVLASQFCMLHHANRYISRQMHPCWITYHTSSINRISDGKWGLWPDASFLRLQNRLQQNCGRYCFRPAPLSPSRSAIVCFGNSTCKLCTPAHNTIPGGPISMNMSPSSTCPAQCPLPPETFTHAAPRQCCTPDDILSQRDRCEGHAPLPAPCLCTSRLYT